MKRTTTINIKTAAFVLLSCMLSVKSIYSQNVTIPDNNFKAALVANAAINTDADSEISYSEAYAYAGIMNINSLSINDITGIEAFSALKGLSCAGNNLTTLDLSYNVSLTNVNCSSNSLTTLNVFGLTSLDTLDCTSNNLTCLDLHTNTGLTRINCSSNNLTSLNLKNGNNPAITYMSASSAGGMLYCIQVDNAAASAAYPNWYEDTWSTYNVSCGAGLTVDYTNNAPVCFGTPVSFTDASTGFINYWVWNFGDGTSSNVQNPTHAFGGAGSFWVTLIAGNCNASDTMSYNVNQGNDVTGHVTYSGGDVTDGVAVIMPYVAVYGMFDTAYTSPLDASGNFLFPHVLDGDYVVKIFPDTLTYPALVNTYYESEWAWDSATIFSHGCTAANFAGITMVEITPNGSGPGLATGIIVEGFGFGRAQGDPIHGVDVKLGITGSSNIVATTETDVNGTYTFSNLNYGTYTVYVDIPGLLRDSVHTFTIDSTNTQYYSLHYGVDSTSIYIFPGIGIESYDDPNTIGIYPNPVKDLSIIEFSIKSDADVTIEVLNMYGIKVQSILKQQHMSTGDYYVNFNPKNSGLKSGVYLITLNANGKRKTIRTIVLE